MILLLFSDQPELEQSSNPKLSHFTILFQLLVIICQIIDIKQKKHVEIKCLTHQNITNKVGIKNEKRKKVGGQGGYSLGGRVVVVLIRAPGVVVAPRPPPFKYKLEKS